MMFLLKIVYAKSYFKKIKIQNYFYKGNVNEHNFIFFT